MVVAPEIPPPRMFSVETPAVELRVFAVMAESLPWIVRRTSERLKLPKQVVRWALVITSSPEAGIVPSSQVAVEAAVPEVPEVVGLSKLAFTGEIAVVVQFLRRITLFVPFDPSLTQGASRLVPSKVTVPNALAAKVCAFRFEDTVTTGVTV